jgi:hypothetical protein
LAWSRSDNVTVNGTPSAVPLDDPKLERMSLRTMPDSVSTFGPFDPSPGYGPAVSSGISSQLAEVADPVGVDGAAVDASSADPVEVDPVAGASSSVAQPTRVASPTPANRVSARRRLSVLRSYASPRSCSGGGSR